jgi:arylsulfatase A
MTKTLNRRTFLKTAAAAGAAAMLAPRQWVRAAADQAKPNFVFILADDQGYGDLGCYGATNIKTPNIDRMAAEGMKFTDFYVSTPVCTPTRSSLMTGCYPRRIGLEKHVLFPNSVIGLNPDEITIAELLKAQGYATTCIGKWHLGYQRKFLPTKQGFDSYFGIPFSNDMKLPADMTFAKDVKLGEGMTVENLKGGGKAPSTVPLMRGQEVIEYPVDQATLTERYTEEACKFIAANKDKPFLLYLPHTMPHYPLHVSEKFKGKSQAGLFGDVIECLDWSTGRILQALKESGVDERTLVIYTSDNGAAAGSSGPLRGKKGSTWEGGVREPCIMRWPGKVPAGTVCKELATIMDVLPTMAKLAGTNAPTDRVIDGKDVWPLISGQAGAKTPHEAFFYHTAMGKLAAVRSGKWKLHIVAQDSSPKKKAKDAPQPPPPGPQLYDLDADIGEKNNVAAEHPDVVKRLTDLLEKFDAELRANSRPVGKA